MKRLPAVALLMLALALGCTTLRSNKTDFAQADALDKKLSRFSYIEEGKVLGFAVDVEAARYREDTPYFPLQVAVANKSMKKLTVKRESFWLVDSEGNRYSLAGVRELSENYSVVGMDKRFTEFQSVLLSRWPSFLKLPSNFFPGEGLRSGVAFDQVELPSFAYFTDMIYFPHPETGVVGQRFELFLDTEELEEPVFLKFKID